MGNAPGTVTPPAGLDFALSQDSWLRVTWRGRELFRYVYRPDEPLSESPRPYLHPLRTLGGCVVSVDRPHDHALARGLSLAPGEGGQRHARFEVLNAGDRTLRCVQRLRWLAPDGREVATERRGLVVTVLPHRAAWRLDVDTALDRAVELDGGLFWRGPRGFEGGTVRTPAAKGGDDLDGVRAPWIAFSGRHDGDGSLSTVLITDDPDHPAEWFVRSERYAALGARRAVAPRLRYSVVVADGELDAAQCAQLAGECGA
ncbi:PmoA family protein [Dactylosporangium sp. CA-233914]|uniref:DUF6807 domain-containing protein n=1 Tax=Dactylosporangium sp. CA-233914 TaxID=3239934 RepID=UPI003D945FAE